MDAFSVSVVCISLLMRVVTLNGHILPEDLTAAEDEQLVREKRENFLESFLDTIPFFHIRNGNMPSEEPEEDHLLSEDLRAHFLDEVDEEFPRRELFTESTIALSPSISSVVGEGYSRTPTSYSSWPGRPWSTFHSTSIAPNSVILSHAASPIKTPSPSSAVASENASFKLSSTSSLLKLYPTASVVKLTTVKQHIAAPDSLLSTPVSLSAHTLSSLSGMATQHLASTSAFQSTFWSQRLSLTPSRTTSNSMTSSVVIQTSKVNDFQHQIIDVVVLSAENPVRPAFIPRVDEVGQGIKHGAPILPNEQGYGGIKGEDILGAARTDPERKNMRFLYGNIILPLLSGLIGAALIVCGIMTYRCCRRRKLRKVRYFGGKPNADFVRLAQHMSLLSETESDED